MGNNQFKSKKMAVIGAGITGLYLAWKLSERGHRVVVFEKRDKIGKEACSGLFSERILEFIPQSRKLIQNQIASVLVHFPKKTVNVKFSKPFLLMSHAALDGLVADLAQKAGAEIILNYNCARPHLEQFNAKFDRVIGCDGANSVVRKSLGLKEPTYRLGIQGFVPQEDRSNYVETWAVRNGFIWRIPRGNETEYGIIAGFKDAKNIFDEFITRKNIKIARLISASIPQGLIIPKNKSVTLCGDAAGLTKPWSGGGVVWGLMAADLLLKNFPDFVRYQIAMKKFFVPKIILSKTAVKIAYFLGFHVPWLLPKNFKIESDFLL